MPDKITGSGELHEATRGGEHILIRRANPEDKALYLDFLRDVNAEDLRLRFFAHIVNLPLPKPTNLAIWTTAMKWFLSRWMNRQARCLAWCA